MPKSFHEFDYSPRHCWELKDGTYTTGDTACNNWYNHPKSAGQTEYLRWLREFGVLEPGIVTGFPEGWLKLDSEFCEEWNEEVYCENYGDKVKAFLDPAGRGVALVEILDESLIASAAEATIRVEKQYEEMLNK